MIFFFDYAKENEPKHKLARHGLYWMKTRAWQLQGMVEEKGFTVDNEGKYSWRHLEESRLNQAMVGGIGEGSGGEGREAGREGEERRQGMREDQKPRAKDTERGWGEKEKNQEAKRGRKG